jgi:hypothetical protein
MPEISIDTAVSQRIDEFRQVFVDVAGKGDDDVTIELLANVILIQGFDLMLAEFFNRLDDDILKKSLAQLYEAYPACKKVESLGVAKQELVNIHLALSKHYPKQFFAFMLAKLKDAQWKAGKEAFEDLFRKSDSERNGYAGH